MKFQNKLPALTLACAVAVQILASGAYAQAAEEQSSELPRVEIVGTRDPALLAYKDVVMMRKVFAQLDKTQVRAALKVTSRRTGKPPQDLQVNFSADGKSTPIALKSGFVLLNDLPSSEDPAAEFLSNKRKGSLQMEILLVLDTDTSGQVLVGDVKRALDLGNEVRAQLPWYLRLLVPQFGTAAACFAAAGGSVTIAQPGGRKVLDAATHGDCVAFTPKMASADAPIEFSDGFLYLRLL